MKMIQLPRRSVLPAIVLCTLGLAGCASTPDSSTSREELLQRAAAYWNAVKTNDMVAAWAYEEVSKKPGWTLQAYLKRGGIVYEEVQVLGVEEIEGNNAKLNLKMTYSVPVVRIKGMQVNRQDEWVRIEGQWYHAYRPSF